MVRQKRKKENFHFFTNLAPQLIFLWKETFYFVSPTQFLSKAKNRISLPNSKNYLWPIISERFSQPQQQK